MTLQQVQPIRIKELKGTQLYDRALKRLIKEASHPHSFITITDKEEKRLVTEVWHETSETEGLC